MGIVAKRVARLQHPAVKEAIAVRRFRSAREETGKLLLVGKKMIAEYKHPLLALFSSEDTPSFQTKERFLVSEEILQKITGLKEGGGAAALVSLPPQKDPWGGKRLLFLDGLQDPGNLGSLLRTAWAFGWDGVIATPDTVDFFNDKALRAGRGAHFHLSLCTAPLEKAEEKIRAQKRTLYIADLKGAPLPQDAPSPPLGLLLGGEGQGVRSWAKTLGSPLSLPMLKGVESLNVAIAGGIFLHALGAVR